MSYDANGNLSSLNGYNFTWNGRRLATAISSNSSISYTYNNDGIRTSKTVNGATTYYVVDENNNVVKQYELVNGTQTNVIEFVYDSDNSPIYFTYNNSTYYYEKNMQGDIVGILDTSGNTVVKYSYDIWGKLLSTTGMLSGTVGVINPLRYRGYYYDTETALYYLQSRYYSPDLMRFISRDDPALSNAQGEPLGSNLYAYCGNDPVNYVDPTGNAKATKTNRVSGIKFSFVYSGTYRALSSSYRLDCYIGSINVFAEYKNGIIKVWNKQSNIARIFNSGRTKTFAYVLMLLAAKINKNALSGRTINGIAYELICHYVWFKQNMLKSHTEVTDCGATRGRIGFDNNAYIFEKDSSKLASVERLVEKGNFRSAGNVISSTLLKLGWQKIKR